VYKEYAFDKALQYLKAVMKDRGVTAVDLSSDMDTFLDQVEFQWNKHILLYVNIMTVALLKEVTVRESLPDPAKT